MIDRSATSIVCALFLLAIAVGCTPDGQSVATSVSASAEPLDPAALNGKTIRFEVKESDSFIPKTEIRLSVIGKTIIWPRLAKSRCILKGNSGYDAAILYTLDQPRTGVKIPCEGERRFAFNTWAVTAPAEVSYSSTMSLQGNVLELSGELTEHNFVTDEGNAGTPGFTVTEDVKQQQHVKIRISGDKCQILDFTWTTEVRQLHSSLGQPTFSKRSAQAMGCSII
ncbi:MAG: hypothetical protein J0J01_07720 [Reyranella sp.]|uniref:hypothetical protein n=1 Tax=Reyranella sp. TaxID=1929291 RepID=UPI001ACEDBFA|nr:hypothetical protein [Reyranella sp.]MBN9086779.1 hypothetical protein [Reyranella sp.]